MDIADRAHEIEELDRAIVLASRPRSADRPSAEHCEACGEPITQARRLALPGILTCVDCASARERRP